VIAPALVRIIWSAAASDGKRSATPLWLEAEERTSAGERPSTPKSKAASRFACRRTL